MSLPFAVDASLTPPRTSPEQRQRQQAGALHFAVGAGLASWKYSKAVPPALPIVTQVSKIAHTSHSSSR